MTIEAAIKQRLVTHPNATPLEWEKVAELVLDGCKIKSITESDTEVVLSKFANLETLCLNQTGLKSIENFPFLPSLNILELQDNGIAPENVNWLQLAKNAPNLSELSLAGNKIKNVQELLDLSSLPNLKILDLELNPIAEEPLYRSSIFSSFPTLEIVDGIDREGRELVEDEDEEEEEDEDMAQRGKEQHRDSYGMTLKNFYESDISAMMHDEEEDEDFEPKDVELSSDEESEEESDEEEQEEGGQMEDKQINAIQESNECKPDESDNNANKKRSEINPDDTNSFSVGSKKVKTNDDTENSSSHD